jgi:AcrR family transcriptional regulator
MPAAERREQLLRAATTLISERGYWGLSLQDVADACELSQPGVLHHFASKDALLVGVLEYRDQLDVQALAASLGLEVDVLVRAVTGGDVAGLGLTLTDLLDATVERNAQQREIVRLYSVLQAESLAPDHPAHEYFAARQERALTLFSQLAADDTGSELAAHALALLDGLQLQWLRDPHMDLVSAWRVASGQVSQLRPQRAVDALH